MKNGRCFNFQDICDQILWDTGYLVKKLQGYRILRPPNWASVIVGHEVPGVVVWPLLLSEGWGGECLEILAT